MPRGALPVVYRPPGDGDTRERAICNSPATRCTTKTRSTWAPRPTSAKRVLLCKRNIEPRWGNGRCLVGFMELAKPAPQARPGRLDEEAGARIEIEGLFSVLSVLRAGRCTCSTAPDCRRRFDPGHEIAGGACSPRARFPWDELAFRTARARPRCATSPTAAPATGVHTVDTE